MDLQLILTSLAIGAAIVVGAIFVIRLIPSIAKFLERTKKIKIATSSINIEIDSVDKNKE